MGIFQRAYETYCAMEQEVGAYEVGKQPLAPVSHLITAAQIEITLNQDGKFLSATEVDKKSGKIIIPATLESAGRTSAPVAHPLCEQLGYLCGLDAEKYQLYLTQLEQWNASSWSHPKLQPILTYVKSGSLLTDLARCDIITLDEKEKLEKDKRMVCWRIINPDSNAPAECWKDKSLFQSFIGYYQSTCNMPQNFCMVSGAFTGVTEQHPKGVVALHGNAKIISANDKDGFTYRGRLETSQQTSSVGYVASQKAHAALQWLVANQGVIIGGRTFLCWDPNKEDVPTPLLPFLPISDTPRKTPTDYRRDLQAALSGKKENIPLSTRAVIAVLDASTKGRLSVTYYSDLPARDFIQRLHDWDETCCWYHGKNGIWAPTLCSIVNYAYGTQREEKGAIHLVTDDRLLSQQVQRLLSCRVDCARMPTDILRCLVDRVSNPVAYDNGVWREMLFVTCAVIQKYHAPILKEDLCMDWELNRKDPSFQFGRLLAAMERAELDYYGSGNDIRQTNAMKSLPAFKKTPLRVFERVNSKLESAYLPRLSDWHRNRYYRTRDEIIPILCQCGADMNAPLNEFYLIGFSLQRNAFFTKNDKNDNVTTENEEE